jgi:hypothetical protein
MTTDPVRRRAEFREEARKILRRDREPPPTDTTGAIARALERAYKAGLADAQLTPEQDRAARQANQDAEDREGIAWIEIPPRLRDGFYNLMRWHRRTCGIPSKRRAGTFLGLEFFDTPIDAYRKWYLHMPKESARAGKDRFGVGDKILRGLANRGLFVIDEESKMAISTELADRTWLRFLMSAENQWDQDELVAFQAFLNEERTRRPE